MNQTNTSRLPTLSAEATQEALTNTYVLRWWQAISIIDIQGLDAITLLNGLCTQAVERIETNHSRLGLFLDSKAKIIAPAIIHRLEDNSSAPHLALELPTDTVEALHSHFRRYRLRAKVSIEINEDLNTIALVGPDAYEESTQFPDLKLYWNMLDGAHRPTMTLVADAATCSRITKHYESHYADPDTLEADRIEAKWCSLHDLLPGRMPAEVGGMIHAVSLDAGCYLGQEPVARLHYRGHANRTIRLLRSTSPTNVNASTDADPTQSLALRRPNDPRDTRPKGQLTSWATSTDGTIVALGVLRREISKDETLILGTLDEPSFRVIDEAE